MEIPNHILKKISYNINNYSLHNYLFNYKAKLKCYEHYMFIEDELIPNLNYRTFRFNKENQDVFLKTHDKNIFDDLSDKFDFSKKYKYIYEFGFIIRELYESLKKDFDDLVLMEDIEGELGKTKVSMYIKSLNSCFISNNYSASDILNLLSIKNLNIYVFNRYWINDWKNPDMLILKISITEKVRKKMLNFFNQINTLKDDTKKLLSKSKNSNLTNELDLDDVDSVLSFYKNNGDKVKDILAIIMMHVRGKEALNNCVNYFEDILLLSKYSSEFLRLAYCMQVYANILSKYKETRVKEISRSRNSDNISSGKIPSIKFTDELIAEKEFNLQLNSTKKWCSRYMDIINSNTIIKRKGINKGTIYEEAIKEITNALYSIGSIKKAILFGSVSNGEEKYGSDIDIAIEMGFNCRVLTKARQRTVQWEIESILKPIQEKYANILPGFLEKIYNKDLPIYIEPKPFHIINLSLQKKTDLKAYDKARFFEDAIILFDRDGFDINIGDEVVYVKYEDLDYTVISTKSLTTYGAISLTEKDNKLLLLHLPFYNSNEEVYPVCTLNNISFTEMWHLKEKLYKPTEPELRKLIYRDNDAIEDTLFNCSHNDIYSYFLYRDEAFLYTENIFSAK